MVFMYSSGTATRTQNYVFSLVNPVYDINTYIFKVHVFTKQKRTLGLF